jgi:sulfatase modifying factor 1
MRMRNIMLLLAAPAAAMGVLIAYGLVAVAVEAVPKVDAGSCAAYSGLPSGNHDTAGMTFIQAGTFTMGSEGHQRSASLMSRGSMASGSTVTR